MNQYQFIYDINTQDFEFILEQLKQRCFTLFGANKKDYICIKFQGEIIGFGRIWEMEQNSFELGSLWMHKRFRGRGIIRELIHQLYKHKFSGNGELYGTSDRDLYDRLFKRFGFIEVHKYPDRFIRTVNWAEKEKEDYVIFRFTGEKL